MTITSLISESHRDAATTTASGSCWTTAATTATSPVSSPRVQGTTTASACFRTTAADDEYFLKRLGQGRGNFEPSRDVGSFGFLFDTGGGTDMYSLGGKNNSLNYKTQWGILLDTN